MLQAAGVLPPNVRFDHLLKVISSQRFLKKQGLGNEVPHGCRRAQSSRT